ncbi:MAG: type 1 glutamine amidotransferase [Halobacteriovoraceae bacterium]|jgi:GMP synthase-like glutamine amidotransferase|nr:type 1 glutamine amidotransferase [Halobacteriovoraceae bacterium]
MIGILNAYHFDKDPNSYQKDYSPMLNQYLKKFLTDQSFREYNVAQGQFPKSVNECDGWIVTGSPASCYDENKWILQLIEFTQKCHQRKKKLLGICFGHQLIALALGGEVQNSNKGWGVGIKSFTITKHKSWMSGGKKSMSLLFSHKDQVTKLPPNSTLLAADDFCPYQMYSIEDHIFSLQGHPEFSKEYAKKRYDTRAQLLGKQVYDVAIDSLSEPMDSELFAHWIKIFFTLPIDL